MNKLDKFLTQVGGRFSTLTLKEGSTNKDYCAQFVGASPQYVTFNDVSTGLDRKVSRKRIVSARVGNVRVIAHAKRAQSFSHSSPCSLDLTAGVFCVIIYR